MSSRRTAPRRRFATLADVPEEILERILALVHPASGSTPADDKRTWREPRSAAQQQQERERTPVWTAMDVLAAYADKKGWVTAKAGRPDVNRAGNAGEWRIVRAYAWC